MFQLKMLLLVLEIAMFVFNVRTKRVRIIALIFCDGKGLVIVCFTDMDLIYSLVLRVISSKSLFMS